MDVWLIYRLLADEDGPGGECEAGPPPDDEPRRELFTFPEPEPGYGPSIGEMAQAIRERHGRPGVVLRTEFPQDAVEG